jgi:integrase/recombinase XerD
MGIATYAPAVLDDSELIKPEAFSYHQSVELQKEVIWRALADTTLKHAIDTWLETLTGLTRKNYRCGLERLTALDLINPAMSLQEFSKLNHNTIIDKIKKAPGLSEATKQARAACFISLTRFISRRTDGIVRAATPCKEGSLDTTKTFGSTRSAVKSEALEPMEWIRLIAAIDNKRDALVVKLMLQGAKRISEVLALTIDKVDLDKRQAHFKQLKTRGEERWLVVNLPENLTSEIKALIGERQSGLVFLTDAGNPIQHTQVYRTMKKAATAAGIKKNVHPHVMRASAITHHRGQGVSDAEIVRLTGQSLQMMNRYDKSSLAENASRIALV